MAPDPAPLDRLPNDVAAALGRPISAEDVVAIAVSGGPDSMALLALAYARWPGQVIAATVDHGLRAGAAAEAAMVAAWCATCFPAQAGAQLENAGHDALHTPTTTSATGPRPAPGNGRIGDGVPHATLRPATQLGPANIQAAARAARYALLTEWATAQGATILATAHHADDQAETFLMRAARGSGMAGLAGIRPRRQLAGKLVLIRPLLGWRRATLREFAEAGGIPFVDDPSNTSDRHDRTRFRALLGAASWLDAAWIARSARYLAEADDDLRALEGWLLESRAVPACAGEYRIDIAGLPREILRRLARAAIDRVRQGGGIATPAFTPATNIEHLLDALAAGASATQAGIMVSVDSDIWHFRPAPPRRNG